MKLIFLIVTRAVSLLGLSRREWWWKDAEILVPQVGLDRGRGFGVATVRFPRSPHRTRRATLTAPGAPRALPCRQLLGAAGGPGVHGVGMLPPR